MSAGSTSAITSSMPTCGGDGAAARCVVAGQQHRAQPERPQLGDRLGAGRLDGVGDDEHAAGRAVPARDDGGVPGGLGLARRRRERRRDAGSAQSASSRARPDDDGVAVDDARDAEPGAVGEGLDGRAARRPGRRAASAMAGADRVLGGVLDARRPAAAASAGSTPAAATTSTSVIVPVVTVPVLSSTTVSTRAGGLQHLGTLDQDARAARRGRCRPAARSAWPAPARTGRR